MATHLGNLYIGGDILTDYRSTTGYFAYFFSYAILTDVRDDVGINGMIGHKRGFSINLRGTTPNSTVFQIPRLSVFNGMESMNDITLQFIFFLK